MTICTALFLLPLPGFFLGGCGPDINKDLLKARGSEGDCIEQLIGNDNPLTPQDIGEIAGNGTISVSGFVEETGGGLANFGAFYTLFIADDIPAGSILVGTLQWESDSSFLMDVWVYLLEGVPVPLPLAPGDYLEKTDATFRLAVEPEQVVEPGQEVVINILGVSGDPGDYAFRLELVPPE